MCSHGTFYGRCLSERKRDTTNVFWIVEGGSPKFVKSKKDILTFSLNLP